MKIYYKGCLSVGPVMTSSVYISSLRFARHYEYTRKDFRFSDELGKFAEFLPLKKVAQIASFHTTIEISIKFQKPCP